MNILKNLTIASILFASAAASADGIGFNIGPFSLQLNSGEVYYANDHRDVLDSPICYAIANQKRLGLVLEVKVKVSANEIKITTKRLVVEPYAFGMTSEGKPVLKGNVVEEKLIKEVAVKYGENEFEDSWDSSGWKKKGYFSGWFKSDKSQNIDIEKLTDVHVINNSYFDAPKNFKGFNDDKIQVICQLPVTKE